jgi:GT2 family glycosyltransferase
VRLHPAGVPTAVFGRYRSDPDIERMPLFERWYAQKWDDWSADYARGVKPTGSGLCTGNVSLRRQDYLRAGGFDLTLDRSEDAELGLKLEELGVNLVYSEAAYTLHGSDHTSLRKWIRRAYRYGICDRRIARKHPALAHADPWRYWYVLPAASRPVMWSALTLPWLTRPLAYAVMVAAMAADRLGARRPALKACGAVFVMEYFRGLRDECGGRGPAWRAHGDFLTKAAAAGWRHTPRPPAQRRAEAR